jgi:hypothetical protein
MKKIVSAAGLAALGVAGLHAAAVDGLSRIETSKPWSLKANLRGFYDDNVFTSPDKINGQSAEVIESVGIEVRPSATINLISEQTRLSLSYEYGYRWYEDRPGRSADESHIFDVSLTHDIDQNTSVSFGENFVFAQEPEIVGDSGTNRRTFRSDLDSIHNRAFVSVNRRFNSLLSGVFGYQNDLFEYQDSGREGSFSSLLDRVEHKPSLNLLYQLSAPTALLLGYQFKNVDFNSSDEIATGISSDRRNSDTHYVYGGVNHAFSDDLSLSARAGAQFVSYTGVDTSQANSPDDSTTSPYLDLNLNYRYYEGSSLSLGVRNERNQTDLALLAGGDGFVLDQETLSIYGSINHQLTSKITANVVALYAMNDFGDSVSSLGDDDFFSFGAHLSYTINKNLNAELGYNFDDLKSDAGNRSFDRNRAYVGLRAMY